MLEMHAIPRPRPVHDRQEVANRHSRDSREQTRCGRSSQGQTTPAGLGGWDGGSSPPRALQAFERLLRLSDFLSLRLERPGLAIAARLISGELARSSTSEQQDTR